MPTQTRHLWIVLAIAVLLPLPALARGEAGGFHGKRRVHRARLDRPQGFELGLRAGYGVPVGNAFVAFSSQVPPVQIVTRLSSLIEGQVPIWLDLGYRLRNGLYLGGYAQIGPGIQEQCTPPDCYFFDLRVGFNARYHFLAGRRVEPWVGLGLGYELLYQQRYTTILGTRFSSSAALHGFEFLNAQVGVDFRVTRQWALAPFFTCAVSQYERLTSRTAGAVSSRTDFEKTVHLWLLFGLRVAYNFGS
jgi:hypothetical protein